MQGTPKKPRSTGGNRRPPAAGPNAAGPNAAGSIFKSLGVRLFLWLFGGIVLVFAVFAFYSSRRTSHALTNTVTQHADRTSDIIERAIRYGMLLNDKDDVHNTLRNIADGPGVSVIRIYDKNGHIIFSTQEGEKNRRVDMQA